MRQIHFEIAKERFLEMMAAEPEAEVGHVAALAVVQATIFLVEYEKAGLPEAPQPQAQKKLRGCRACHGSGGKASDPCKVCNGTGKVEG